MTIAPIEYQVRFVEEANWGRVHAATPEEAASAFVAERDRATGKYELANNRRGVLVVVAASHEAYVEACYRVIAQLKPAYDAAVVLPGTQRPARSA